VKIRPLRPPKSAGPILTQNLSRFPPGTRSDLWTAPTAAWTLAYTLSGTVREFIGDAEMWLHPGDLLILKPGISHRWEVPADAPDPWAVAWLVFNPNPDWILLLDQPESQPHCSRIPLAGTPVNGKIRRGLIQACRWAALPLPDYRRLAMNAIERVLIWLQMTPHRAAQTDPRIRKAITLLSHRMADPPALRELTRHCGLSASRLNRLFQSVTGQTPHAWHEHHRLTHAQNLLRTTGLPIKVIAATCGYSDQRHFATRFKKTFGSPPSAHRPPPPL